MNITSHNHKSKNTTVLMAEAEAIPESTEAEALPSAVGTVLDDDVCVMPMSFGQEQLWLSDQIASGSTAYSVLAPLRIRGLLDVTALERTLNEIVRRHEVLRTVFDLDKTGPVQIISGKTRLQFIIVDLSSVPKPDCEAELLQHMSAIGSLPFDIKRGPVCRAHLLKLAPDDHVLIWNMHHIVSDGLSHSILTNEIGAILPAFMRGEASPLPELPIQYADYSQWQREQLPPARIEIEADWWRQQLAGAPAFIELPTDRPFGPTPTFAGHTRTLPFKPGLAERLQTLAKNLDATVYTATFAAFFALMQRYTGQTDIVVGTPLANRGRVELESLIGYFVNALPIRLSVGEKSSFRELVTRLRSVLTDVYDHQELPFERLVAKLLPERAANRNPVFQVIFQCHKSFMSLPQVAGLEFSRIHIERNGTPLDLNFEVIHHDGHWHLSVEYSTEVFNADTIDRMLGHYQTLLEGIVANPDEQLARLPLLTQPEQARLTGEWNHTAVDYPREKSIHQLFETQVERAPGSVALVFEKEQLTYRELNERANRLARRLRTLGVNAGTLVGIYADRSIEYVVATLGILKSGGAYVPLDSGYPVSRLQFMFADAALKILITNQPLPLDLDLRGITVVDLAADSKLIRAGASDNLATINTAGQPAYVIYTSGSTGQPKGVVIPHRGVVRLVCGQQYAEFGGAQRFLLLASTSFDATTFELWGPLLNGSVCVIFPRQLLSFEQLESVVRRQHVTCLWLTAGLFNQIIDARPSVLETVQHVLAGGEALSVAHVQKALNLLPHLRLTNGYGPTESTTFACCHAIQRNEAFPNGAVPIGRPIANTTTYILDAAAQPLPVGIAGELYIGGDGLALGYLNQPELTAEKFVSNPFSYEPGARLYRTGDLARWLPDGNLEFLGRLDQQVKIRGFRIEPGEIETVLATHDHILNAAVIAQKDISGNQQLVAYLVARSELIPTVDELRVFLLKRLPDYMIPAAFVNLAQLPLTSNGKLDRRALPAIDENRLESGTEFVAPRTPTELALAQLWCDLIGVQRVGIHDNFFALGGHSLLAVRLVNETNRQFGHNLLIPTFFRNPTVEKIAGLIEQETHANREAKLIPLQPGEAGRALFFLDAGIGQCRLAQLLEGVPASFATTVPLSTKAFHAASQNNTSDLPSLTELAAAHTALIQQHYPTGSCLLAGHSFGGLLAFEVAHQLQAAGRQVEMIFLLDSWATSPPWWRKLKTLNFSRARQSLQARTGYCWSKLCSAVAKLVGRWFFAAKKPNPVLENASDYANQPFSDVPWDIMQLICAHAKTNHHLKPLAGRGVFIRAMHNSYSYLYEVDPKMGWDGLFEGGLEIVDTPGDHFTLLKDPHLVTLAGHFKQRLKPSR